MINLVGTRTAYFRRLVALGCILLCGAALYCWLVLLNVRSPQLQADQGRIDFLGVDLTKQPYMLTGDWIFSPGLKSPDEMGTIANTVNVLTGGSMEGKTYRLILFNCPQDSDFCLMLSRPRGSRLFINDKEVLSADGGRIEMDQVIDLSPYFADDTTLCLTLQVPVSGFFYSGYQGILVGTEQQLLAIGKTRYFIEVLCLGIYTALALLCLALFVQKPSEHYILLLVALCVITALRFIDYSAYFREYVFPRGSFDFYRLFICFRYVLCRQIMGGRSRKWLDRAVLGLFGLQLFVFLFLHQYFVQFSDYCSVTFCVLEWLLLLQGVREGAAGALMITSGWTIYVGMELFYRLLDYGIIPQGMVDVQIKPVQYAHAAYLIAFTYAVLGKFARKFREADELAASLEQKVLEQTEEIRSYSRQVVAVQEQRQQFMVDVVHNLRNPLFTLGGYMDMLEEELPNPTQSQKGYIDRINNKLSYVNQMVEDMLLVSRLENGQITFSKTIFNAESFLLSIAEDNKVKLSQKGINIQIHCDPSVRCTADRFRLRQVIDNLIDNAFRHSDCKNIYLRACLTGNDIRIEVADDGSGISPEKLEHVFDRYSRNRSAHSAGLGLPIARGIVQGHGGDLVLKSEEGKGTRAMFTLPQFS
jgi:two-component system phosphate regulon sensor histidine kinase PhoR